MKTALAIAALAGMGAAQSAVLTFDGTIDTTFAPFAPLLGHLDEIQTQGFWVDMYNTKAGAAAGDLVGALVNGADNAATCAGLICPSNNTSNYLAALNDGLPDIGRLDGKTFQVTKFDASFIAASGDVVLPTSLLLRVEGYSATALVFQQDFYLPGPSAGAYSFATYALSAANAATPIVDIAFRGYACTTATTCSRSLDKAQFALDNITTAVPEASTWMMMGLGLAAFGAFARRRNAA
nr:NF038120 family PEP-CTERM protein [uncultured Roseateles sp.]